MSAVDFEFLKDAPTLAPSTRGMGPNTYLNTRDFYTTLVAAFAVHLLIFGIYSIWPRQKVTDIPVRALSFKIGGQERIAAYGLQTGIGTSIPAAKPVPIATKPVVKPKITLPISTLHPVPVEQPRQRPSENTITASYAPVPAVTPVPQPVTQAVIPPPPVPQPVAAPQPVLKPAIAPDPQRYVREYGVPMPGGTAQGNMGLGNPQGALGGQGTENIMTAQTAEEIRARYEQMISAWVERHKIYPAEAGKAAGRVIMRVRVDRQGYVRYYAIDRTSGNTALDRAAIEMIRNANPMPAAPANYPADNLIEFLIPILFEAP